MAKIKKIEFIIQEVYHKVDVNCSARGTFSLKLPIYVHEKLRIDPEITSSSLGDLETKFEKILYEYKTCSVTEEFFIIVAYQAKGKYIETKDGGHMYFYRDDKYKIDVSFGEIENAVGIDFEVCVKETINDNSIWYEAKIDEESGLYKKINRKVNSNLLKRGKVLPFNETAIETLNQAQEKFRSLSEMLFKFINQDEEKILLTLTSQKLLN
jgi:hypothetical protein